MSRMNRIQNGLRKENPRLHPVHPVNPVKIELRLSAMPFGEHAAGAAEIPAQEPTVAGRFYGQAVLQR
ncbi:MAG: hypothetical protein ABSC18_04975 [Verrucomicrobiota bacterium]